MNVNVHCLFCLWVYGGWLMGLLCDDGLDGWLMGSGGWLRGFAV